MSSSAASEASSEAQFLKPASLARTLKVSRQAIHQHIKAGLIKPEPDGTIDVRKALEALSRNLHPKAKTTETIAAQEADATAPPSHRPASVADKEAQPISYHVAKTLREAAEASIAQLRLRQMQGSLVDAEEVARLRFTEFRSLRDPLGNVGARLKHQLATETEPNACERIVNDEIAAVLTAFADQVLTRTVLHDVDEDDPD